MRKANPEIATAATWERLADTHAATVAYSTLRVYVTRMPVRAAHAVLVGPACLGPPVRRDVGVIAGHG